MKKTTIRARVHENIKGREKMNRLKRKERRRRRNEKQIEIFMFEETVKTSFCKVSRRYLQMFCVNSRKRSKKKNYKACCKLKSFEWQKR